VGYFRSKRLKGGEIWSSTMPHKVNNHDGLKNSERQSRAGNAMLRHPPINSLFHPLATRPHGFDRAAYIAWHLVDSLLFVRLYWFSGRQARIETRALNEDLGNFWEMLAEPVKHVADTALKTPYEQ